MHNKAIFELNTLFGLSDAAVSVRLWFFVAVTCLAATVNFYVTVVLFCVICFTHNYTFCKICVKVGKTKNQLNDSKLAFKLSFWFSRLLNKEKIMAEPSRIRIEKAVQRIINRSNGGKRWRKNFQNSKCYIFDEMIRLVWLLFRRLTIWKQVRC